MLQAEARWVDDISCDKQLQTTLGAICYTVASLTRHTEKQYDKKVCTLQFTYTLFPCKTSIYTFHIKLKKGWQFVQKNFFLNWTKLSGGMIKNGTVFVGIRTLVIRTFNCSKKWISILNKVDFENIKTQVATLKRLTEKQYDKKVCPHCFDSSYSVQKKIWKKSKIRPRLDKNGYKKKD